MYLARPLQLVDARDSGDYAPDSRELIRVENELRHEFSSLEQDAKEMADIVRKDEKKQKVRLSVTRGVKSG